MSEMGEFWRYVNAARQEKRADNRESSPKVLKEKGIEFTEHNNGAHLVVKKGAELIDFLPGTGKWISRKGKRGHGVFKLVDYVHPPKGAQ